MDINQTAKTSAKHLPQWATWLFVVIAILLVALVIWMVFFNKEEQSTTSTITPKPKKTAEDTTRIATNTRFL